MSQHIHFFNLFFSDDDDDDDDNDDDDDDNELIWWNGWPTNSVKQQQHFQPRSLP